MNLPNILEYDPDQMLDLIQDESNNSMNLPNILEYDPDQMLDLIQDESRRLFLGPTIYDKCNTSKKVDNKIIEDRLKYWKDHDEYNAFKQCSVEDIQNMCNLKDDPKKKYNKCYQSLYDLLTNHKDYLEEHNQCSVCLEYDKNNTGEYPNQLGCGHYFHNSCIEEIIKAKPGEQPLCPQCKQPITMLHGLYSQDKDKLYLALQKFQTKFLENYLAMNKKFMTKNQVEQLENLMFSIGVGEDPAFIRKYPVLSVIIMPVLYQLMKYIENNPRPTNPFDAGLDVIANYYWTFFWLCISWILILNFTTSFEFRQQEFQRQQEREQQQERQRQIEQERLEEEEFQREQERQRQQRQLQQQLQRQIEERIQRQERQQQLRLQVENQRQVLRQQQQQIQELQQQLQQRRQ